MGVGNENGVTKRQSISLTAPEAAELLRTKLAQAASDSRSSCLDTALDNWTQALGLALQLGPAPAEQALEAVLEEARRLSRCRDAQGLSALGPTLTGLVTQMREARALPPTAVMEAWATLVSDVGIMIGQVGLALDLPRDRRRGLLDNARTRATFVDEATEGRFGLSVWLAELRS